MLKLFRTPAQEPPIEYALIPGLVLNQLPNFISCLLGAEINAEETVRRLNKAAPDHVRFGLDLGLMAPLYGELTELVIEMDGGAVFRVNAETGRLRGGHETRQLSVEDLALLGENARDVARAVIETIEPDIRQAMRAAELDVF